MKFIAFFTLIISQVCFAGPYYLGAVLGTPTGVSGKYQLNDTEAIQADASGDYIAIDYALKHPRNFGLDNTNWVNAAGLIIKDGLGARILSALEYNFEEMPVQGFGNVSFNAYNKDGGFRTFFGIAVGARYNFD